MTLGILSEGLTNRHYYSARNLHCSRWVQSLNRPCVPASWLYSASCPKVVQIIPDVLPTQPGTSLFLIGSIPEQNLLSGS